MKTIGRLILSAIFLILTALLASLANGMPQQLFAFYPVLSANIQAGISSVTAAVPFAVWEVLVLLMVLWAIYTLVRVFREKGKGLLYWLSGIVLTVSTLVFVFTALWGLNHFSSGVCRSLDLPVREYSEEELRSATQYYAEQANALAQSVTRDESGCARLSDFSELAERAGSGYAQLSQQYPVFRDALPTVKKLASWPLFSRFGVTGIFICFTAEPCVNPDTYETWLPFTMCHELAHLQSVAAEDEANFCAYLACMENENPEFRYSGAYAAYTYCHNALSKVDAQAAAEIFATLDPGIVADVHAANAHYARYEGKVQDAAQKVNDVYLKVFDEESGVQSYGEAADLLIAWYLQKKAD